MRDRLVAGTEAGNTTPAPYSVSAGANQAGVNVAAAEGLHSKLRRVFDLPYIMPDPPKNALEDIIRLLDEGRHVILSFGDFNTDLDYLLVTNLLTRRIRETWEKRTNAFRKGGDAKEPRP